MDNQKDGRIERLRSSVAHLLRDADPATGSQLLALEAARFGYPDLAAELDEVASTGQPGGSWTVDWATGRQADQRLIQVLRAGGLQPALTELDGRPVVVGDEWPDQVRVWDALTAETVNAFEVERDARVVAALTIGGRPLVLTGHEQHDPEYRFDPARSGDRLRAWCLRTGEPVGEPLTVAKGRMITAASVTLDGRELLVTGGWDGLTRLWDLATGEQVAELVGGHHGWVVAVVTVMLNGRPVAITAGERDCEVLVRDLTNGQTEPLVGHRARVAAVATAESAGRTVAVTAGDDGAVQVWDLTESHLIHSLLTSRGDRVGAVAAATVDGRTLVVTGGWDGGVRVWDLATGPADRRTVHRP